MIPMSRFLFLFSLFAASCHTVKFTERGLAGSGFYQSTSTAYKKHNRTPNATEITKTVEEIPIVTTEVDSPPIKIESTQKTTEKLGNQLVKPGNTPKTKHKVLYTVRKAIKPVSIQKSNKDNPEEGSIRWFIYLLLCFVLPPLAYYLIKREADTLFWVCFFCFLLTTTFFGGFRYGLLGLISIVIALLTLFQIDI